MNWKIEKKYIKIGVMALIVIVLALMFQYSLNHETKGEEFKALVAGALGPIFAGFILAYLLNPLLGFFERNIFKPISKVLFKKAKKESTAKKFTRGCSVICTFVLFFILLGVGLYLVIPQVYQSLMKIVTDASGYYETLEKWVLSFTEENEQMGEYLIMVMDKVYNQALDYLNKDILPNMDKIVVGITTGIVGGLKMVLNVVLALIISVYVLIEKEKIICVCKKLTYSLFNIRNANSIVKGTRYVNQVFGGFINGKIIDSFIIGVLAYIFMIVVDFEYPVLISMIIGVTNVIPYFGPFIGAFPSILIMLMVDIKQGFILAVFILILQQLDGNVIGPLILGDRLKISSMWILFAILVGGGFFGVPGMILGAPCFACIYALVGVLCKKKLKEKELPIESDAYYNLDEIHSKSKEMIYFTEDKVKSEVSMQDVIKEVNNAGNDVDKTE